MSKIDKTTKKCKDLLFKHYKVRDSVPEGDKEEGQITVFTQMISLNEISKFAEDIAKSISEIPCGKCKELEAENKRMASRLDMIDNFWNKDK